MKAMGMDPQALRDMPKITSRLQYYFVTYNRMSRSRDVSMSGPLPIKVTEILAYCEMFQIQTLDERERMFNHVANLDNVYLDYLRKRQTTPDKPRSAQA